ncbi:Kinesin-like protein kif26a [Clonorchis sinensis]|uniref:Kinesin-like protein kif26a n=1 Tax=Clonorchis sinensis TaxID=79923 RepID=A0A3R7JS74_CLOSI|nr:Kinesin-like protein kif26a [Clonorchis sinensis]
MSTSDCPKCIRREKTHSRRNYRKSLQRSGDFPSPSDGLRSGFQSTLPVPRQPDGTQPALRFQFARLLRSSPPSLPPSLDELRVGFESAFSRDYAHFTSLNTGKVKVIVCVRQPESTVECRPLSTLPNADRQHHAPSQYLDALLSLNCNISNGCVAIDHRRNQLTLIDPTPPIRRRVSITNPKLFTFDAVLATQDQQLLELSRVALTSVIQQLLRGQDGCILTIGHKHTGKTRSMVGTDTSPPTSFGIIPCAISWLFQVLNKQKEVTGIRFSVRVSAVALNGPNEEFCDLLEDAVLPHENDISPSQYLRSQERNPAANPLSGDIFQSTDSESVAMQIGRCLANQREIRVANAERAAYLLDVALTKRAAACADKTNSSNANGSGLSHMLFTFHVYQCCVEQNETGAHVFGGRTRLHLLDLGCGRYGHPTATTPSVEPTKFKQKAQAKCQSPVPSTRSTNEIDRPVIHNPINTTCRSLSISGMANVILALLTGQRHLPFRDSALTHLIKEAMTGTQVHPCVIAHIDSGTQYYTETLQILQLASKLSRLRRRRVGPSTSIPAHLTLTSYSEDTGSSVESCSDSAQTELYRRRLRGPRMGKSSYGRSYNSDVDFTSSSEQSCETVIYLGRKQEIDDQIDNAALLRLGPRGKADGSVDARSASSGQLSGGEQQNRTLTRNSNQITLKKNTSVSGTGVHVVKRMIPRTNAKVWPRAISPKLKEALLSQEETWIDGPKVTGAQDVNSKATECVSSSGPHWSHYLCSSSSVCSPTYSVVQPRRHSSELGTAPCVMLSKSATITTVAPVNVHDNEPFRCAFDCTQENDFGRYPSISNSSAWQADTNAGDDQNQISSVDASSCSTLEHCAKLGPRALSDISERTEETETVPDGNTVKSSSTGPLFECLSLLRLDGLPYLDEFRFEDRSASHSAELVETILVDTTDKRKSPLKHDGTRNPHKAEKSGRDENERDNRDDLEMCLSFLGKAPSMDFSDILNPRTPELMHRLGYSPLKKLKDDFVGDTKECSAESGSYFNGCGEKLLTMDESVQDRTPIGESERFNYLQSDTVPKERNFQLLEEPNKATGWISQHQTRPPLQENYRRKTWHKPENSTSYGPTNNSLSRVAAWVDSIVNPTSSIPFASPCEVQHTTQIHEPTARKNLLRASTIPRQNGVHDCGLNPIIFCTTSSVSAASTNERSHPSYNNPNSSNSYNQHNCEVTQPQTESCRNRTSSRFVTRPEVFGSPHSCNKMCSPCVSNGPSTHTFPASVSPSQQTHFSTAFTNNLQQNPVFSPPNNQDFGNFSASQQTPYWNILQPDSFSLPRCPQTINTTKHLVKAIAFPSTGDQVQNSTIIRERCPDRHAADFTGSIQEKELKDSKSQRGFRFPSFPIFRSFRLRRDRKKEKLQVADPLRVDENKAATQYPSTIDNMTGFGPPLSPTSLADLRERCHSCSPTSPMRSTRACASTLSHVAEFTPGNLSLSVADSPHLVLKSTTLQSGTSVGMNASDFVYRSVSSGPILDARATSSPLVKQLSRREPHGRQQQSFHLLRNDPTEGTLPVSAFSHQMDNNQALFGLPNSPSVPLNSPHYPGTLFTPICRSGRRSVNGGPASSGYESMRIGTSELSLSHPDSASECSGILSPGGMTKDVLKPKTFDGTNRCQRHSSTTGSRASGSAGSGVSLCSPMRANKAVESQTSERTAHWPLTSSVSSFLKIKYQHSCQ